MYMKSFTNAQNGKLYNHISKSFGIFIFLRQAGFSTSNQPLSFADASWFPRLHKFHPLRNPAGEEEQIRRALALAGGNKSQAAKLLGIDRKTLYNKLHLYGIE